MPEATMMRTPLLLTHLLERAAKYFPNVPIVSRRPDRSLRRSNYAEFTRRAWQLARRLQQIGLKKGDRVATLMWNHQTHLEAYYGIPAAGGVLHTLNLRLHPDELAYIANHAEDRFLIVDDVLLPIFEEFRQKVNIERVLVVPSEPGALEDGCAGEDYEKFLAADDGSFTPPALDENDGAAMCYTSGTTGSPKGVLYSHRALVLHTLALSLADVFAISMRDTVMPVMSMFHANAWGVPYCSVMCGAKLVFPHRHVDAHSLLELLDSEKVTFTGAVPTVWLNVIEAMEKEPQRWKLAPELRIAIAGSAAPESLLRRFDALGVPMLHFWGMTETSPVATSGHLRPEMKSQPKDAWFAQQARQGMPVPYVEARATNDNGEAAWDDASVGEIELRGPWVASAYFKSGEASNKWTDDGWFRSGDMVTVDSGGSLKIVDRAKDLIKSGGEWISSVDVENALVAHPAVREAAVVAVPHPKWSERPLAVVVLREGTTAEDWMLREFLLTKFAKWQVPDAFVFVDELPHTSTGKLLKTALRERYKDWKWEA